jgi:hypothetical protein
MRSSTFLPDVCDRIQRANRLAIKTACHAVIRDMERSAWHEWCLMAGLAAAVLGAMCCYAGLR